MGHSNRKFLVVLIGTLLLIPFILMLPGVEDSMPNRIGLIMGIIPLAIFAGGASAYKPWQAPAFFCGIALIFLGIGLFVLQGATVDLAEAAQAKGRFSAGDFRFWTTGAALWVYSVPVISMALGVNVISAYISAEAPAEQG
jgi:hypothetical protein